MQSYSYKDYLKSKSYRMAFLTGAVIAILGFIAQFYSSVYATYASGGSVTDIILSNTRVYDVDGIFVYGTILMTVFIFFIGLKKLNRAPFIMKAVGVFTIIRSVFVSITHISPFPNHIAISSAFWSNRAFYGIFTGNDLFFSGHTGIPFLMALMFWNYKPLRYTFLCFSLFFAVVVLLGHLHYSIDVLAAFFITYAIFDICKFFFKKDWALFQSQ